MTDATVLHQIVRMVDLLDKTPDTAGYVQITNAIHNLVRGLRYSRGEIDGIEASREQEDVEELVERMKGHARGVLEQQGRSEDPKQLSMLAQAFKNLGASLAWLRGEVTLDFDSAIQYLHSLLEGANDDD
jgi:hypothetical protein